MSAKVLIVEDEETARGLCVRVLESLGLATEIADSTARALAILESGQIDIILSDVRMPGLDGIELLKVIRERYSEIPVVMMTGYGTISQAVQAIQLGAYDYITKPFNVDDLERLFRRLLERQALLAENLLLREQLKAHEGFGDLIGTSSKMREVYRMILKIAEKRHPVLILGESGTGKELVARAIHAYGPCKHKPFVPVDCGALPPTLIESELFGHVRGAFTGATQSRRGLLAEAEDGSAFLDEIAELPLELQTKLLRVLQEREIRPVGGNERTRLQARIIAGTHRDLEKAIKQGTFRMDLFFRLNVVSISVPPLRERKSDIPLLVQYFVERYCEQEGPVPRLSYEAMVRLMNHDWPGNVRELENCVQRALALKTAAEIEVRDLPPSIASQETSVTESEKISPLQEAERRAILQALEAAGGDRPRAAKLLGIGKTTIYRKLKEYSLEDAVELLKNPLRPDRTT